MVNKKSYILYAFIAVYFGVAWFFPWNIFQTRTTISVSYLWDLLFAVIAGLIYKMPLKAGSFKGFIPRGLALLLLASLSILFLNMIPYSAPFRYLERPFLQLLVLAPLLEEVVFRYAILGALLKNSRSSNMALLISSILFSLSHLPGIWHLPPEFQPFFAVQIFYTFVMGWILGKARIRNGGVLEPVLLHFLFNLAFYLTLVP